MNPYDFDTTLIRTPEGVRLHRVAMNAARRAGELLAHWEQGEDFRKDAWEEAMITYINSGAAVARLERMDLERSHSYERMLLDREWQIAAKHGEVGCSVCFDADKADAEVYQTSNRSRALQSA